jgi:photosystem II stability/assembly factor-like uncharacterized protein
MIAVLSPNGQHVRRGSSAPSRLLVGTLRGVSVIDRTAHGAWTDRGRSLEKMHCSALVASPEGDVVVAGAHDGGVFVSRDGGDSWERRTHGLAIEHVFSLAYASQRTGGAIYAGTQPVGLFRSDDDGDTWRALPAIAQMPGREKWWFPGPGHHPHVKSLTVHPHDSRIVFAAIEQGALLKSVDGGERWRELDAYSQPDDAYYRDVHLLVISPANPDELFMTTGIGVYRSTDAGETWARLTQPGFRIGYPDHLIVSPRDADEVFLAGASADPTTWHTSHRADGTVMRSADRGRTWSAAADGLPAGGRANIEAMSMAVYPDGFTLFAGNTDGAIFASDDGARSWSPIAAGLAPVSKVGHYRNLQAAGA